MFLLLLLVLWFLFFLVFWFTVVVTWGMGSHVFFHLGALRDGAWGDHRSFRVVLVNSQGLGDFPGPLVIYRT